MSFHSRKRRHPKSGSSNFEHRQRNSDSFNGYDSQANYALYVQAHEADLIYGQPESAASIEASHGGESLSRLIKLHWQVEEGANDVWVDRFDARLLLDGPMIPGSSSARDIPFPPSPAGSGWSDLPSDSEDTFFFGPGEDLEEYRRDKRQRILERDREERLKALQAEDPVEEVEEWGGSDEEPDSVQLGLMHRTANHIMSSPNSAQLEMRILANHGADKRFAFLRGRWKNAWANAKRKACLNRLTTASAAGQKDEGKSQPVALGGLAAYGDSDESGDENSGTTSLAVIQPQSNQTEAAETSAEVEDMQEARRRRAREWAEKRKAAKARMETNVVEG